MRCVRVMLPPLVGEEERTGLYENVEQKEKQRRERM